MIFSMGGPMRVIAFICLGLILGCSSYRLGHPGEQWQGRTIWVDPVILDEALTDLAVPLNRELREAILRSGQQRIAGDRHSADGILSVTIERRTRRALASMAIDTGRADVMQVELAVRYELRSSDGLLLKEGVCEARGQVFREDGFSESLRQRMPSLVRSLARDVLQAALLHW
jgi:hypothetical protein